MATYIVDFTNVGVPTGGLTPEIIAFRRVDGTDLIGSKPAIEEIGDGAYKFTYVAEDDIYVVVDGGVALSASERYVRLTITPDDDAFTAAMMSLASHAFIRMTNHTYDTQNRLTGLTVKGYNTQAQYEADTPTVTKVAAFTYDVQGRRSSFAQATTI